MSFSPVTRLWTIANAAGGVHRIRNCHEAVEHAGAQKTDTPAADYARRRIYPRGEWTRLPVFVVSQSAREAIDAVLPSRPNGRPL
jgi:hypothetical protein